MGFAALDALIPSIVGNCTNDQSFAANGDAVQSTSGGLLVWRKADNLTAFTDGTQTWVVGPNGLEQRLNSQRFTWEPDGSGSGPVNPPAQPQPQPPATGDRTISLSVSSGHPGAPVVMAGRGFNAYKTEDIFVNLTDSSGRKMDTNYKPISCVSTTNVLVSLLQDFGVGCSGDAQAAPTFSDSSGAFVASFNVPAGAAPGPARLCADSSVSTSVCLPFTVL